MKSYDPPCESLLALKPSRKDSKNNLLFPPLGTGKNVRYRRMIFLTFFRSSDAKAESRDLLRNLFGKHGIARVVTKLCSRTHPGLSKQTRKKPERSGSGIRQGQPLSVLITLSME